MKTRYTVGLLIVVLMTTLAALHLRITQKLKPTKGSTEPVQITWSTNQGVAYFRVHVIAGTWNLEARYQKLPEAGWFHVRTLNPGDTAIQWQDQKFALDFQATPH